MPELPEVEAARRAVAEHSIGKKIIKAIVADDSKVIDGVSPKDFEAALVGKTIVAAHRKGKNMWIQLDSPPFPSFQFGMDGAVYIKGVAVTKYKRSAVKDSDEWPSKYSKFFVELADGLEISFTDKRRFAKVRLLDNPVSVPPISELGPDALTEPMTADEFCNSLRKKNIGIKALLIDQSYISGIGNWMADEVLYQARIHPLQTASSLSKESGATLLKCINEVIEKALEDGADSSQFPDNWIFHSREKKPGNAFVDGKKIDLIKAGGRVDETSENSEELLDEGEEGFKIEAHDLGNEDNKMLKLKNNDLENAIQQVLGIERADLENDGKQLLDIHNVDLQDESEHVLEFERNGRERNCEQMLEVQSNDRDSNSDQMLGIPCNDNENATDARSLVTGAQTDHTLGMSYLPPVAGMEFESYDDAYNYYNCYAKELGFGIRVKSSWTKRNSNEKRGAVLCCNCEGFKTMKETCTRRKETRTGCLAMIRLRLVESNRWRLDEVKLEHNHLFDHQKAQNSRSHKKMEAGIKRKSGSAVDVEVKTIKLYRTPAVDAVSYGSSSERDFSHHTDQLKRFRFRNGDLEALHTYFRQAQLADPNFFYIMDLNDEGYVRNVFWIDSRSRAAYGYFGDVVVVDSTCLSNKHDIPLLSFSGLNHHGQSVLMGCGLLAEETFETYVWLMRAWLTCMLGRPPQTIVTDQCKALEGAISEVFPRAHHCLHLSRVMQSIHEKLEEVGDSQVFQTVLNRTVYSSMKIEEFETGWEEMIQHFANRDHEWLNSLYEDRERWAPVYLKNSVFAGIFTYQPSEYTNPFFHGYLDDQMTWTEFFKVYKLLQQKMIQREALDDIESRELRPVLRTRCSYEKQVSELYTKAIFLKFQEEVVRMPGCFSVTHIHVNGPIIRYMVKERDDGGGASEAHNFEVVYDKVGMEVRCICCCFSFRGYLCRHALTVLKYNGAEEIPSQYILTRWRKDMKRLYIPDLGSNSIDISNPVQWHEHLYRRAMQVVAEGMASQDHHMVAWQALKESLNKVRLAAEKPV